MCNEEAPIDDQMIWQEFALVLGILHKDSAVILT
jgi:hypothetical protein